MNEPRPVDLRLAIPAAAAWGVLAITIGYPDVLLPVAVGMWLCGGLTGTLLWLLSHRGRTPPWGPVFVLACCVGALVLSSAVLRAPGRAPEEVAEAARSERFVEATAVTGGTVFAGTSSFPVTITGIEFGQRHLTVSIPARAFGEPSADDLGIGTTVVLRGTLRANDPGDGTAYLLFTSAPPSRLAAPPPVFDWANRLRDDLRAAAAKLPGDGGALLPGLAIGDTSAVSPELDAAMKSSSLSHLTAVSGANCAVVVALVILVTSRMRMRRVSRIGSALVVLVGFVVLVTPEPSVLRAAVMAAIVLLSSVFGRAAQGIPILALAVTMLLTNDPWLARDYGFTLSVLATAGLLLLARPLTAVLSRILPVPLAAAIAIPLAAQLACQPVLVLLAPSIPVFGVVANILAEPAAPIATVIGLIACLLLPFVPSLGAVVVQVAWFPAAWIAATAKFFSAIPGSQLDVLPGFPGVCAVIVFSTLALFSGFARPRLRRISSSILGMAIVSTVVVTWGAALQLANSRPNEWQFGMCDVGQGDSSLVRSGVHLAVIDTGSDPGLLNFCLDSLGIDRVDLLVLTHFDTDHVGGASALIGRVDRVLVGPEDRPEARRLMNRFREAGAVLDQVYAGVSGTLGDLAWRVLWPPPPVRAAGIELGNDSSVTVAVEGAPGCFQCLTGLFLGDLGEQPQNRVLGAARVPQVDVVKVAHHGSKDQSARMYERVHAAVALIGVGTGNTYGHPTQKLLNILDANGTMTLRTDQDGMVLLAPPESGETVDGAGTSAGVTVWTEKGG